MDYYAEFDYSEENFNSKRDLIMDSEIFQTVRKSNDGLKMLVQTKQPQMYNGYTSDTIQELLTSDNYKSIDI